MIKHIYLKKNKFINNLKEKITKIVFNYFDEIKTLTVDDLRQKYRKNVINKFVINQLYDLDMSKN